MSRIGVVLTVALLAALSSPTTQAEDSGWFFSLNPNYTMQDRDNFRFGEFATDSNDPGVVIEEPSIDHDGDGLGLRFAFGKRLDSGNAIEFFASLTDFDDHGGFSHDASDFDPADAPAGAFFDEKNPAYQVVFIDGPGDSGKNLDRLERGTVGLRLGIADAVLDYDSTSWEAGADWSKRIRDDAQGVIDFMVGGHFASVSQDFDHDVSGVFKDGKDEQTSELRESLDEWFLGPHVGVKGLHPLGESSASFAWHVDGTFYYHDADFDGSQDVANEKNSFEVDVHDNETDWSPRLSAGFGFVWKAGERAQIGIHYRFDWWNDVAMIVNPEITLADIDGDDRWVADTAAHLGDEDLTTHTFTVSIRWH